MHTDYAVKHYGDLLIEDPTLTSKRRYLQHLRKFPVCITTTGLHGSIGWKLGEYVAFSKAIVTEALHYQVPGKFEDDVNFVTFDTPQACVAAAAKLCEEHDRRRQMMIANWRYYHHYVRPDALVLNSLARALTLSAER